MLLADGQLGEGAFAVGAGVVSRPLVYGAHVLVQITGTIAHLGAEATAVSALQCVIIQVNLELSSRCLLHSTIAASIILNPGMSHHVHLEQLLAGEASATIRLLAGKRQLRFVLVRKTMISQLRHGIEYLATVFANMRLVLLAQFVALAHV